MRCNHCGEKVTPFVFRLKPADWLRRNFRRLKLSLLLRLHKIDMHEYCQRLLGVDARSSDGYKVVEETPKCMYCGVAIPESEAFMRGMVSFSSTIIHSKSGVCSKCIAIFKEANEVKKPDPRPLHVSHYRLDLEYHRDGSLRYCWLRPDRRKLQQKANRSRLIKWERAGCGIVSEPHKDEAEMRRATYYMRGPISQIAATLNYDIRAFQHDLSSPRGGKSWLKRT